MAKIYHESVELNAEGKPTKRAMFAPVGGIWYISGSTEWKAARRKLKGASRAIRDAQWKENAEAERAGQFVPIPGVFPVAMQFDLWEQGKFRPTFWQELWEGYGGDE
jgi:hypothetical protein